jgi:hypothetical protein
MFWLERADTRTDWKYAIILIDKNRYNLLNRLAWPWIFVQKNDCGGPPEKSNAEN